MDALIGFVEQIAARLEELLEPALFLLFGDSVAENADRFDVADHHGCIVETLAHDPAFAILIPHRPAHVLSA